MTEWLLLLILITLLGAWPFVGAVALVLAGIVLLLLVAAGTFSAGSKINQWLRMQHKWWLPNNILTLLVILFCIYIMVGLVITSP